MMTNLARETFAPHFGKSQPLRAYPLNSPKAKARLIVLALLADGHLDKCEFETLDKRGVYASLGLGREDFIDVLLDFCSDAARLPNGQGSYQLSPKILDSLFAEVDSPAERKVLMRHIFKTISSDGKLAAGEERLFWNAIDAWNLRIADISRKGEAAAGILPPEHYYG